MWKPFALGAFGTLGKQINLKQHSVQEAYLKNFEDGGRIWSHSEVDMKPILKPAKKCAMETDFQNYALEHYQNKNIETPAINVIRNLNFGNKITENEANKFFAWTELHIIRNQKFRKHPETIYNIDYYSLIEIEQKFSNYYNNISVYKCQGNDFFVTSDNPVMEMSFNGIMIRVLVISPSRLVLMSPNSGYPTTDINFTEMINSALYVNRYKYLFSHKKTLPLKSYVANAKKYNLCGAMTINKFKLTEKKF